MAKVMEIIPLEEEEVFDIEVEDTHNFFANGVVVHNCMVTSKLLAGFSGPMANKLRKACSKKKPELMAWAKTEFFKGAQPKIDSGEISKEEVEQLFQNIETQAGYSFNASHATTYGMVTAAELWLKEKFPVQFFTALLNNTDLSAKKMGSEKLFTDYLNYVRSRGIRVASADINHSGVGFSTDGKKIFFGIGHIRDVGSSAEEVVKNQPYASFEDFCRRAKVNSRVIKGLIYAGAFDCFADRNEISKQYLKYKGERGTIEKEEVLEEKKSEAKDRIAVLLKQVEDAKQTGDFARIKSIVSELQKLNRVCESRVSKPLKQKKVEDDIGIHTDDEWEELEVEYTGLALSKPPVCDEYKDQIMHNDWAMPSTVSTFKKKTVRMFGKLTSVIDKTSKNGNYMHIAEITDGLAVFKFFIFSSSWETFRKTYRVGDTAVFPLSKFDDGDTRFFTDRGVCTVLKRG